MIYNRNIEPDLRETAASAGFLRMFDQLCAESPSAKRRIKIEQGDMPGVFLPLNAGIQNIESGILAAAGENTDIVRAAGLKICRIVFEKFRIVALQAAVYGEPCILSAGEHIGAVPDRIGDAEREIVFHILQMIHDLSLS